MVAYGLDSGQQARHRGLSVSLFVNVATIEVAQCYVRHCQTSNNRPICCVLHHFHIHLLSHC